MTAALTGGLPPGASTIAMTPAPTEVKIKGWVQVSRSPHLDKLQAILDEVGVEEDWIDLCAESQPSHRRTTRKPVDDAGQEWSRLYAFRLDSGSVVGIIVAKKIAPRVSERHCAFLLKEGSQAPTDSETEQFFRMLSVLIQD